MTATKKIVVAYGDGIGPEIMEAALFVLRHSKAKISVETIEIGQKLYTKNYTSGIDQQAWDMLYSTDVLLKSPITTPQGGGYKSLNVSLRKSLGLYANVRPCSSFAPFIQTKHPHMDLVIIRENQEDIYAGIEYRHTHNVYESIKLISKTGSQKIIRYAFEYAMANNRKKVTCFIKDNIMKFSDGIFHQVFKETALQYPSIQADSMLMDIGSAKLASRPQNFDVIVTQNLYGDIISDIAAEISGSVGLAGSSNIGPNYAMFEAVHGSAPDIAGKGIANPCGLINAAVMMLIHIGQADPACLIENAMKKTIEDGISTPDIYQEGFSHQKVSTMEFAHALVERLGQKPSSLGIARYITGALIINNPEFRISQQEKKKLTGVDVFISGDFESPHALADLLNSLDVKELSLQSIASMGLKVWPNNNPAKIITDHWCCRFFAQDGVVMTHQHSANLLDAMASKKLDFIKLEHLYEFDEKKGYSLAQSQ